MVAYAAVCAACVGSTAFQVREPEIALTANTYLSLHLLTTAMGMLREDKATSGFLDRWELTSLVLLSVAVNIGCYAVLHQTSGIHDATAFGGSVSAIDALYFSIMTFTTLGFGDLQPGPGGRIYAAIQALSGYVYLGIFKGLAVNGFNPLNRNYDDQNARA